MAAAATTSAIRALARAHAASRVDDVLSVDELAACARLLASVTSLNYDAYCMVRDALPAKASKLLTASLFARVRHILLARCLCFFFFESARARIAAGAHRPTLHG